jgi:hypothetical protein
MAAIAYVTDDLIADDMVIVDPPEFDFVMFAEGRDELTANGLPSTCVFDLSTLTINLGELEVTDTFAGGYGVATGTGYTSKTQAEPTPVNGIATFAAMTWSSDHATDWTDVTAVVLRTASKLI